MNSPTIFPCNSLLWSELVTVLSQGPSFCHTPSYETDSSEERERTVTVTENLLSIQKKVLSAVTLGHPPPSGYSVSPIDAVGDETLLVEEEVFCDVLREGSRLDCDDVRIVITTVVAPYICHLPRKMSRPVFTLLITLTETHPSSMVENCLAPSTQLSNSPFTLQTIGEMVNSLQRDLSPHLPSILRSFASRSVIEEAHLILLESCLSSLPPNAPQNVLPPLVEAIGSCSDKVTKSSLRMGKVLMLTLQKIGHNFKGTPHGENLSRVISTHVSPLQKPLTVKARGLL